MYPEHCTGPRPTPGHLKRSLTTLTVYNGESMKHYGTIDLDITLKDYTTRATFFVADTPGPIILGLPATKQMKIITVNQIKTDDINTINDLTHMYPDWFECIGNFEGTYHIVNYLTIPHVVHVPRRRQISMIRKIKEELDQMERTGVIEKVTEPTDWVSSLVYAPFYRIVTCDARTLRVILNMLLVIDSLPAFGTSKYEYREYTTFFF